MDEEKSLREHLVTLLKGGQAYESFEVIVASFKPKHRGTVPPGADHSPWEILEHMRIAQRDILDYSRNEKGDYREKDWPDDYWPKKPAPPNASAWKKSVEKFHADRRALVQLARKGDLFRVFPWGEKQTLLRELLLAADHNSHHLGQLVILRRLLGDE
jgi:uncharacterized damage-inducible protein DinB